MSSGTLSSSPGPSTLQQNSKRALSSHSRDAEDRLAKKSRTTSEEPSLTIRESSANTNSTAKDKKKRQRKKKRKVSVVVIEDGHARIKDSSHRGVSRALVPLTHPSPVKLGESSRSQSKSTVLANDERDVEEAVHGSKDKGKGKAVEPDEPNTPSAEQEIARLIKELAFKNELIEKHQTTLTQTQQSITCQVCLELMYNPYALSPCGHLACYDCLLSWFKATPEDQPDPPPVLVRKKTCPHCRAAITDRPVQVWGVKSIVNCFAKSGLLQGSFLSADEAAEASGNGAVVGEGKDPWDGIFRRKQRGGRGATRERLNDFDLQRDIFDGSEDERGAGILDDEDGGVYRCYDCLHEIWDGLCSNCGRAYPNFDGDEDDGDFYLESDEDDFGDDGDDVGLRWMAQAHLDFHHALGFDDHQQPPQQHEEEDPHDDIQARLIDIEAERAADEGREPDFRAELPFVGSEGDDDDDDGEEEEYEGSFIDDENDVGIPARHLVASSLPPLLRRSRTEIIELSSGSDDDEFPAHRSRRPLSASASARRGGGGRGRGRASSSPIEVSDDEDEVQEVRRPVRAGARAHAHGGSSGRRLTGARPIVILSDSDDNVPARRRDSSRTRNATRVESTDEDEDGSDDGIDPNLALRIAAEERDLYGEDDSITRHRGHHRRHNFAEEEDRSSAVLDDDADEDMSLGAEHEDDEEGEDSRESYDFYNDSGW